MSQLPETCNVTITRESGASQPRVLIVQYDRVKNGKVETFFGNRIGQIVASSIIPGIEIMKESSTDASLTIPNVVKNSIMVLQFGRYGMPTYFNQSVACEHCRYDTSGQPSKTIGDRNLYFHSCDMEWYENSWISKSGKLTINGTTGNVALKIPGDVTFTIRNDD